MTDTDMWPIEEWDRQLRKTRERENYYRRRVEAAERERDEAGVALTEANRKIEQVLRLRVTVESTLAEAMRVALNDIRRILSDPEKSDD